MNYDVHEGVKRSREQGTWERKYQKVLDHRNIANLILSLNMEKKMVTRVNSHSEFWFYA